MQRIATPLVSQVNVDYPGADPNSIARFGTQNYYRGGEVSLACIWGIFVPE